MVYNFACEASEVPATFGPLCGGLETEAGGVDHWDDTHLHVTVWEVGTACASVVLALDDQVVIVANPLSVASWLD